MHICAHRLCSSPIYLPVGVREAHESQWLITQSLFLAHHDAWCKVTVLSQTQGSRGAVANKTLFERGKRGAPCITSAHISLARESRRAKPVYEGRVGSAVPSRAWKVKNHTALVGCRDYQIQGCRGMVQWPAKGRFVANLRRKHEVNRMNFDFISSLSPRATYFHYWGE